MSANILVQDTREAFKPIDDKLTYKSACAIGQTLSQNKSINNNQQLYLTYEIACAIGQSLIKIESETTLISKIPDKK